MTLSRVSKQPWVNYTEQKIRGQIFYLAISETFLSSVTGALASPLFERDYSLCF